MQWRLQIMPGSQYGEVPLAEGRGACIERGLLAILMQELFGSNPQQAQEVLQQKARQFGETVATELVQASAVQKTWGQLFALLSEPGDTLTGDPAEKLESVPVEEERTQLAWAIPLYGLCLHALCSALAEGAMAASDADGRIDEANDDENEANQDDGEAFAEDSDLEIAHRLQALFGGDAPKATPPMPILECSAHESRYRIARRLTRLARKSDMARDLPQFSLIAEVLQRTLEKYVPASLGLTRDDIPVTQSVADKTKTIYRLRATAPDIAKRIDGLMRKLPFHLTLQPLKQPPLYVRADETTPDTDYGSLIGYTRINKFLRDFHEATTVSEDYVRAINAQQAVAWRINRAVFDTALTLAGLVYPSDDWTEATRAVLATAKLDPSDLTTLQDWVRENLYSQMLAEGKRREYAKPADFLDHVLAREALDEVCGQSDEAPPCFYLAWKADYRGRIYVRTPWLTPQGADLQRALFEFADGEALSPEGATALRRYGGGLAKRDDVIKDLGIKDRQVLTLADREQWVERHEARILASAEAPLRETFWRETAGKPMQFLAFCFAYRAWKIDSSVPIHLPVQIDGTCNGFQHIAALTGDATLARTVNVLPRDDGLPGDLYTEVAIAARAQALKRRQPKTAAAPGETAAAIKARLHTHAEALIAKLDWASWIDRNLAKNVVMTIPYGASERSQAGGMLDAIAKRIETKLPKDDETMAHLRGLGQEADRLADTEDKDKMASKFARSRRLLRPRLPPRSLLMNPETLPLPWYAHLNKGAYGKAEKPAKGKRVRPLDNGEWYGATALAWLLAEYCVKVLRKALEKNHPVSSAFSEQLKWFGKRGAGVPLVWRTPLGFPVAQDKFKLKDTSLNRKDYKVGVVELLETVEPDKQTSALLPNLIHSLDSTHLTMTINLLTKQGIVRFGSIHDCVQCHPNEAEAVGQALRESFAELYTPAENKNTALWAGWVEWMEVLAALRLADQYVVINEIWKMPNASQEKDLTEAGRAALEKLQALLEPETKNMARELTKYLLSHTPSKTKACKEPKSTTVRECFNIAEVKQATYFFH